MARLLVHVEGQTEESFVNNVMAPYLYDRGFHSVSARIVGNARLRSRRGGIRGWQGIRDEIVRHLREDGQRKSTLMVDYYALPASGVGAWPGRSDAALLPCGERGRCVENSMAHAIAQIGGVAADRFVPYVVMHEFEGLLFSDCGAMARGMGREDLRTSFQAIRDGFSSPEDINDSVLTAPSKRVEALVPGYQKPLLGTLAALEVGIDAIRAQCLHFDGWIGRLEQIAQP